MKLRAAQCIFLSCVFSRQEVSAVWFWRFFNHLSNGYRLKNQPEREAFHHRRLHFHLPIRLHNMILNLGQGQICLPYFNVDERMVRRTCKVVRLTMNTWAIGYANYRWQHHQYVTDKLRQNKGDCHLFVRPLFRRFLFTVKNFWHSFNSRKIFCVFCYISFTVVYHCAL
jgi:hypothetical protein